MIDSRDKEDRSSECEDMRELPGTREPSKTREPQETREPSEARKRPSVRGRKSNARRASSGTHGPSREPSSERLEESEKPEKPRKSVKSKKRAKPAKPFVRDYGNPIEGGAKKASISIEMVVLALAIGFVIGFLVFVALWLSSALTDLLWHNVMEGELPWFMPILLCTTGGLIIGLWSKYVGGDPEPLMKVLAQVKQTGSYKLRNIPASVVAFLLPLVFGGSVGLEAGLTGLIAAGCSYIGRTLRAAGLRVKEVTDLTISASISAIFGTPLAGIAMASEDAMPSQDERSVPNAAPSEGGGTARDSTPAAVLAAQRPNPNDYTFRRSAKVVLYTAAAFGSMGGLMLLTEIAGGLTGIPHFEAVSATGAEFLWAIPCLALAYAMVLIHHAAERATLRLSDVMGRFTILKPLVAGVIIGCIAVVLPNVLFCGEEQGFEIQQNWQAVGVAVLLGTGLVKVAATSLCLNMGWHGGNFFPNIYAGISAGYGMALLTGADPMLCVTVVTAAYLGGIFRRPLLVLALLILCFPLRSILWMGLACVIGAVLPLPRALRPQEGSGH